MPKKKSMDLAAVKADPSSFHRHVLAIHEVGPYAVVVTGYCGGCDYFAFVEGKAVEQVSGTLEEALLLAMAVRTQGFDQGRWMARGAKRLLLP